MITGYREYRWIRTKASTSLAVFTLSLTAAAQMTKSVCIDANTRGQDLRREEKLSGARDQFRACSDVACPSIVRDDCTRRLDEVNSAQPTVVFGAKDESDNDLSAVRVLLDGAPLAERLDGTALAVEPGEHVFEFVARGAPRVTRTFVIREGEKDRRERVNIPIGAAPPAGTTLASSPLRASPGPIDVPVTATADGASSTARTLGWAGVGVGAAGVAAGITFGLLAKSAADEQTTDCVSPVSCRDPARALSDHSRATTDGTISTVAFIGGGALVVVGTVLLLTNHPSPRGAPRALTILPAVGWGSTGMVLQGPL